MPNAICEHTRVTEQHLSVSYQTGTPQLKVALEERGLKLHRSHIVSSGPEQVKLCCSRVNSVIGDPHMQRADFGYTWIFDCVGGRCP